jgi:hypothetical protein
VIIKEYGNAYMKRLVLFLIIAIILSGNLLAQDVWKKISEMPFPVSGGQVIYNQSISNPKFYILGGYSDYFQKSVDWIQEYDLSTHEWKFVGSMNSPRSFFIAGLWDTTIVFSGGAEVTSSSKEVLEAWNYKSSAAPFNYFSRPNLNRSYATGHIYGDNLLVIGGRSLLSENISYIVEYNLKSKSETYKYDFPTAEIPREHMSFYLNNVAYIFGGVFNGVKTWVKAYRIDQKQLVDRTDLLTEPRAGGTAVYNPKLRKGYLIGGYNESKRALKSVDEIVFYLDGSMGILKFKELQFARRNPMVVNYENAILVFGGQDENGKNVKEVEMFIDPNPDVEEENLPTEFSLSQNYPNPFNPETTISYQLPSSSFVKLRIFDLLGREVAILVNEFKEPGFYNCEWRIANGELPSGIYIYRLETENFFSSKKMLYLK